MSHPPTATTIRATTAPIITMGLLNRPLFFSTAASDEPNSVSVTIGLASERTFVVEGAGGAVTVRCRGESAGRLLRARVSSSSSGEAVECAGAFGADLYVFSCGTGLPLASFGSNFLFCGFCRLRLRFRCCDDFSCFGLLRRNLGPRLLQFRNRLFRRLHERAHCLKCVSHFGGRRKSVSRLISRAFMSTSEIPLGPSELTEWAASSGT